MRLHFIIICLLFSLMSCDFSSNAPQGDLIDFIPPKSVFILETEDLSGSIKELTNTDFYKNNASLPILKSIEEQFKLTTHFEQEAKAILAITPIGERELASSLIIETKHLQLDSLQLDSKQDIDYAGGVITKFEQDSMSFYATQIEQVSVASASKLIIENVIRAYNNQFKFDATFYKAHKAATGNTSAFIHLDEAKSLFNTKFKDLEMGSLQGLGKWMSVDLEVSKGNYTWSGAILDGETPQKLNLFSDTSPSPLRLHEVTPTNATGFLSLSFSDFETLQNNRDRQKFTEKSSFASSFKDTKEVGAIQLNNGALVYDMVSTNVSKTLDSLESRATSQSAFRNQTLYFFEPEPIFSDFTPLLANPKFSVCTVYDSHFLFAKNQEDLESVLVNITNRSVLSESESFQNALSQMSSSAHMVWGGQLDAIAAFLENSASDDVLPNFKKLNTQGYSTLVFQATHEDNFAFVNGILAKNKAQATSETAVEVKRIKFEQTLSSDPSFFINWRTRQKDIVVQDEANRLHLFSKDGKSIWSKTLDSRIIGEILTFDIYRNTRLQMAFTTQNKLYVIDKNGNDVAPFPLEFEDFISEGLAIFDYDANGKYRFVVVQGDEILMFNKEGKIVKGFDYASDGNVQSTPQHIRIDRKDYIVLENKSGLKILNRTGGERVVPKQKFKPSGNSWGLYQSNFVGTSADGNLLEISENGVVKTTEMNLSPNHLITVTPNHRVTFSENQLNINGVVKTLDYGLYLPPQIHEQAGRTYFSIVDQQASKVYLFDDQAQLVSGFPVFGNSQIDMDLEVPNQISFTVKGDDNALLIYNKKL